MTSDQRGYVLCFTRRLLVREYACLSVFIDIWPWELFSLKENCL